MTHPTRPDTAPLRAAVYVRVAHDHDDVSSSLDRQEEACRAWAERHGLQIAGAYADIGPARTPLYLPPGYELLMQAAVREALSMVLTADHARLGRTPAGALFVAHELHQSQLRHVTIGDPWPAPVQDTENGLLQYLKRADAVGPRRWGRRR